jgi:hypothetical protein
LGPGDELFLEHRRGEDVALLIIFSSPPVMLGS